MLGKFIGGTMLIIGTEIGAGMLALPIVSAGLGCPLAIALLIFLGILMTATALLLLEVNSAFAPYRNSFSTMAKATLGRGGQITSWLTCLGLLYAMTAAYISGNASLLTSLFATTFSWHVPNWINALLFTLILGGAVFSSAKTVDYLNRGLLSIKGVFLLATLFLLAPHINFVNFINDHFSIKYFWAAAPIFLCSFGFQTVIPSLNNYINNPKIVRAMILTGTTTTLIIYIFWLIVTLGLVPLEGNNSFIALAKINGSIGEFIQILGKITNNSWVVFGINSFANIAMTTSFLGVSLGLFDFLADGFKRPNTKFGRLQTALLTFSLPLIFALFYPEGFILALGYASIFIAILVVILPVLMVYKFRQNKKLTSPYRVKVGNTFLLIIAIIGVAIIVMQILVSLHLVPMLK